MFVLCYCSFKRENILCCSTKNSNILQKIPLNVINADNSKVDSEFKCIHKVSKVFVHQHIVALKWKMYTCALSVSLMCYIIKIKKCQTSTIGFVWKIHIVVWLSSGGLWKKPGKMVNYLSLLKLVFTTILEEDKKNYENLVSLLLSNEIDGDN